jgi:hypothetical protein
MTHQTLRLLSAHFESANSAEESNLEAIFSTHDLAAQLTHKGICAEFEIVVVVQSNEKRGAWKAELLDTAYTDCSALRAMAAAANTRPSRP